MAEETQAIVFTGGIGENAVDIRRMALENMESLGLKLDPAKNKAHQSGVDIISTDDSPASILIVPTNEELVIARETNQIVGNKNKIRTTLL